MTYTEYDALRVFGPYEEASIEQFTGVTRESWETTAALYESYAADTEGNEGYRAAAERVANQTWEEDIAILHPDYRWWW